MAIDLTKLLGKKTAAARERGFGAPRQDSYRQKLMDLARDDPFGESGESEEGDDGDAAPGAREPVPAPPQMSAARTPFTPRPAAAAPQPAARAPAPPTPRPVVTPPQPSLPPQPAAAPPKPQPAVAPRPAAADPRLSGEPLRPQTPAADPERLAALPELNARMAEQLRQSGVRPEHVRLAMARADSAGLGVEQVLLELGLVTQEQLGQAIARLNGLQYLPASAFDVIDFAALAAVAERLPVYQGFVPLGAQDRKLAVGIRHPQVVAELQRAFPEYTLFPHVATDRALRRAWQKWFCPTQALLDASLALLAADAAPQAAAEAAVALLRHAAFQGAGGLRLLPAGVSGVVEMRLGGVGRVLAMLPRAALDRLIDQLMLDSQLGGGQLAAAPLAGPLRPAAADRPGPAQELAAQFSLHLTLAAAWEGRAATVEIRERMADVPALDGLGLDELTLRGLRAAMADASGVLLLCHPGREDRAVMYSLLREVDPLARAVVALERRPGYRHGLWAQHAPGTADGGSLERYLDAPADVVLLGDAADGDTVRQALASAAGGRLVVASSSAASARAALIRLRQDGLAPECLAAGLRGVFAFRPVRALCPHCKTPDTRPDVRSALSANYLQALNPSPQAASGAGCAACGHTGHRGVAWLYEWLEVSGETRRLLEDGAPASRVTAAGIRDGYGLWDSGLKQVASGAVSWDELRRAVARDAD